MPQYSTIHSLLRAAAAVSPDAPAVLGLDARPLVYRELLEHVEGNARALNGLGIGRADRVAIVLPNGPEMAVGVLSIAAAAASAPLNPAYTAAEFEFYLADLKPRAVITSAGSESPVLAVAASKGIPVIRLVSCPHGPAGAFRLDGAPVAEPKRAGEIAQPADVALVLHTSGSTSRPKMVPLTHGNLCCSASNIRDSLDLAAQDCCLNIMPLFHIHGLVGAVLASLEAGASVVCTPGFHAVRFFDWLEEFRPTWYTAVPTMHQAILERIPARREAARSAPLRFVRSCSSALPPKLMAALEDALGVPVVEAYGMTEASHQMAVNPLPPRKRKEGSVGLPAGCAIAIMDEQGAVLPQGRTGEVVIRGGGVTPGYENNPQANQSSFTAGWFRTGDQGRLDSDGYLFLTGRSKEIINRGGEKISPREVDEVLMDHPAVAQALAFAIPDERLGEDVGAVVVLRGNATAGQAELREFAAGRLADFKVPRRIVFLGEIPKGPTGKPQRIGLAGKLGLSAPARNALKADRQITAPRTRTEQRLAAIWREVLGGGEVSVHDDFFALGGDSVLAGQLIARMRREFALDLPIFRLFDSPTVAALAACVEAAPKLSAAAAAPIARVPRDAAMPLSFAQQRMWFLTQFEEECAAYTVPAAVRIRGPLRVDALGDSIRRIADRHEILRTTFADSDDGPVQISMPARDVPLPVIESGREARIHELARGETHRFFDLARDVPLRAALVRLAPEDHVLIVTIHHIASDGWSKSLFFRELSAFYEASVTGAAPALPDLAIQYADYAVWQRRYLEGKFADELVAYWKERLAGVPALLELPADRPRPARQMFRGGVERATLPKGAADALRTLSRRESVTLFMTLLGAFQALLSRYSGQTDICVGSPVAGRVREEVEDLIGLFVNVLPMRTDLAGDPSFRQLLARVRETAVGAYAHQDLPFERFLEVVQTGRDLSHSPLFQVMFQLRNFPEIAARLKSLETSLVPFDPGTAQFDLTLDATETDQRIDLALNYNSALFDATTARRMLGHYRTLLEAAVSDPDLAVSRLTLLAEAERRQLQWEWNQTSADFPPLPVHELFEAQAARTPDRVAAVFGGKAWTYAELDRYAGRVAAHLRSRGVAAGALVAICVERSREMLGALLGILKAGCAYVPLDPAYPRERLANILGDAGPALLLAEERVRQALPESPAPVLLLEELAHDPPEGAATHTGRAGIDDLAYVIYTSGSTGKPKGVEIRHRSLTNVLASAQALFDAGSEDTVLALTTISFDIAGFELFFPLMAGARVAIAGSETARDGGLLIQAIEEAGATIIQATPATWRLLLEAGWRGKPGLKLLSTGEALSKELADALMERGCAWNLYGPTETTIWSTAARLAPRTGAPLIGKPLANTEVYVLDGFRQLVPVGVPGELYIGGEGLARGYRNLPALTAGKFVENPFSGAPGARLYRTGDLVRRLPDGSLDFLGRTDHQVKIRDSGSSRAKSRVCCANMPASARPPSKCTKPVRMRSGWRPGWCRAWTDRLTKTNFGVS